jgi:hypothetical protein
VADRGADKLTEKSERPGTIERILFSPIELWVVVLLFLVGLLLVIGFGAAVLDAEREKFRLGSVSRAALAVAEIPQTTKRMLGPDSSIRVWGSERFESKPTGWSFPSGPMNGPDGYILLSRYDGTEKRHKIEFVSLPTMRTVHSWTLDAAQLLKGLTYVSRFNDHSPRNQSRFREIHPWIEENGDLIVKDHNSPLFRVDPCGNRLWMLQNAVYHHSTEADAGGNLWIPSVAERNTLPIKDSFWEDTIRQVSPSGKPLYSKSVIQILLRHGYANWLFGMDVYKDDPTHLNDIEPVLADGPYWKKGDLFLSLRNLSAIMLYRPSTDEIVWMKRGPWISQHDVDILDDHRIGIYDNAVEDRGIEGKPYFGSSSQVMVYDFANDRVSLPLEKAMKDNNIRTFAAGLFTQLPDGSTMIEDETDGRFIIFRRDGRIAAEYINRAKDGWIYHLGWSRYIEKPKGDIILRNLRKVQCNA